MYRITEASQAMFIYVDKYQDALTIPLSITEINETRLNAFCRQQKKYVPILRHQSHATVENSSAN